MAIAGKSNYLETAIINGVLRATTYNAPSTVYVALYTVNPDEDNSGTEVPEAGGTYARQSCAFDAPTNGATANTSDVVFTDMPSCIVVAVGIVDSGTHGAGNLLYGAALDGGSETVGAGNTFTIPAGSLTVTET